MVNHIRLSPASLPASRPPRAATGPGERTAGISSCRQMPLRPDTTRAKAASLHRHSDGAGLPRPRACLAVHPVQLCRTGLLELEPSQVDQAVQEAGQVHPVYLGPYPFVDLLDHHPVGLLGQHRLHFLGQLLVQSQPGARRRLLTGFQFRFRFRNRLRCRLRLLCRLSCRLQLRACFRTRLQVRAGRQKRSKKKRRWL